MSARSGRLWLAIPYDQEGVRMAHPRQSPCAPADVPTTGLNLWARRESGAVNMACAWVAVVLTTLEL